MPNTMKQRLSPQLSRRIADRAAEIYVENEGRTQKDYRKCFILSCREFLMSPNYYILQLRELSADYES